MADNTQQIGVSLDQMLYFKAKQDAQNNEKFATKKEVEGFTGAVRYDGVQVLTEEQKAQARANIGAGTGDGTGSAEGAVRHDVEQALDDDDKARARDNIGAGTGTWADMPDKPFYERGWSVEWDTKPTDTFVPLFEDGSGYYKVSDTIPQKEELVGARLKAENDGDPMDMILSESDINEYNEYSYGLSGNPFFLITTQATEVTIFGKTISFPSEGVWFVFSAGVSYTTYLGASEVRPIDKKYIPSEIGTWADMPDKPFGESGETVIELPSDISGHTIITSREHVDAGLSFSFVKVESPLNSAEEVLGSPVSATTNGTDIDFIVDENHIKKFNNGFLVLYTAEMVGLPAILSVKTAGEVVIPMDIFGGEDLFFEEAEEGLYFLYIEGLAQTNSLAIKEIKKIDNKYLPDGLVTTDKNGLVPASMLPSYVDDTLEGYYNEEDSLFYEDESFEIVIAGEKGKIYVDLNTGNTYRWSGSVYVQLNPKEFRWATNEDIDALFT